MDIAVLAPDTSAANLSGAEFLDSITVLLEFDDFLDPTSDVSQVDVGLTREEGTSPGVSTLFHEADYAQHIQAVTDSFAQLDSVEAAEAALLARIAATPDTSAAADTTVTQDTTAVADTAAAGDPTPQIGAQVEQPVAIPGRTPPVSLPQPVGNRPGPVEGMDRVLPGRRIVAVLDEPIELDVDYVVEVGGAVNINGLGGGGGQDTLFLAAPVPDSVLGDSLAIPDTGAAQPDTGFVAPLDPRRLFRRR